MSKEKIWLSSPHMGNAEQNFVSEAFDTNWIAPLGPNVNGFEKDLQDYNKTGHAAALSSGTAAIHLALILNNVGPGDLVFVQSFTFSATINPIIYQGATPVFIDSEPGTWNMCPRHLEKAIQAAIKGEIHPRPLGTPASGGHLSPLEASTEPGRRGDARKAGEAYSPLPTPDSKLPAPDSQLPTPKAIIPVHLYGMPANMDAIMEIGKKYNLPVIEDAAESLGSTYRGKYTGTFGDMGVYSFNGNKIITTSGGGALVSENLEWIKKARFLATQARDDAPHYQHSQVGYNYRMSNVLAGIGRGQMQVLEERVAQRRSNFERYRSYFAKWNERGFSVRFQEEPEGSLSNRWLSCILINPETNKGLTREALRLAMEKENIECRPLWKPMHLQPVFQGLPYVGDGMAEELFNKGLCLPSGSSLVEEDFIRIFNVLDACFKSYE